MTADDPAPELIELYKAAVHDVDNLWWPALEMP